MNYNNIVFETFPAPIRGAALYGRRDHGGHTFSTKASEIRRFLAVLLLSGWVGGWVGGYNRLPRRGMYWECTPDFYLFIMIHLSKFLCLFVIKNVHICCYDHIRGRAYMLL